MSGYLRYAVIFNTSLLKDDVTVVMDPVRVEVFSGPRSYKVPSQNFRFLPAGEEVTIGGEKTLDLPDGRYIEVVARTKGGATAKEFCSNAIDNAITALSMRYSPEIFNQALYRGWLIEDNKAVFEAWVKLVPRTSIDSGDIESLSLNIHSGMLSSTVMKSRYELMCKFYAKALVYDPGEEKFLFLWTILEIFPMKQTSNIKPIKTLLSEILGKQEVIINERLEIGRMYGVRSNLVHDGRLDLNLSELSFLIEKTEGIVRTVLRNLIGLDYDGILDSYFES